jgi:hypothetical protein
VTRIVVTSYRYKHPPPKKKGRALNAPAIPTMVVHAPTAKPPPASKRAAKPEAAPPPAPHQAPPLPTIVVATNQKRPKRPRGELRMAQPSEPCPKIGTFFASPNRPA